LVGWLLLCVGWRRFGAMRQRCSQHLRGTARPCAVLLNYLAAFWAAFLTLCPRTVKSEDDSPTLRARSIVCPASIGRMSLLRGRLGARGWAFEMRTSQPPSRLDRLLNPYTISVVLRPHAASFFDDQGVTTVASGSWIIAVPDGSYAWPVDGMMWRLFLFLFSAAFRQPVGVGVDIVPLRTCE
jgi:hypothetical protein